MAEWELRVDDERSKIVRTFNVGILAATKKRFGEYTWKFLRVRSLGMRCDRKERERENL